jgi:hypothetical protein
LGGLLSPLSHKIVVSCVGKDGTLEGNVDAWCTLASWSG